MKKNVPNRRHKTMWELLFVMMQRITEVFANPETKQFRRLKRFLAEQ